jgi:LuxR family maltose regulon positive regulatory protein
LTLISAPAGFGKSTLVSEWIADSKRPTAWLSLDAGDSDPARFLTYLITALQEISANLGMGLLNTLQAPQPPAIEMILTSLLNEISAISNDFILVLDDYHVVDAKAIDDIISFLLVHMPPQMHLVIITREDPHLPLARLRARGQLTEIRAKELRFTPNEANDFLNRVMGLDLSMEEVAALESRTEGWIVGLQLAALSMQGHQDTAAFIRSFTGSHHFVLDYLVEEVLQQQTEEIQTFLLYTSILDRLCGPLCDALLRTPAATGEATLDYLQRANLFLIPLDNERRWYRYHHLFADLLRQRLMQRVSLSTAEGGSTIAEYHVRASEWYEANGLHAQAFHHAVAAGDIERAARLVEGDGMPLFFRGTVLPVLTWLETLPAETLNQRPSLWVMYASVLLFSSKIIGVEEKLQAAEAALQDRELDAQVKDLIGHIASIRATLAVTQHDIENIVKQSHRALKYLHPNNLPVRTATVWTLGYAYHLQGERHEAGRAYTKAIATSQAIGHLIINVMASIGLGNIQELDNQLHTAVETYRRVLELVGESPPVVACEAHLGLARIYYEWNDLDAAQVHAQQSLQLARQLAKSDLFIGSDLFLARLKIAQGDLEGAAAIVAKADEAVRQQNFHFRVVSVAEAQALIRIQQGKLAEAAEVVQLHQLPVTQARLYLAQGDPAAIELLEGYHQQVVAKGWEDEQLKALLLQAVAYYHHGDTEHQRDMEKALQALGSALVLAEPQGRIRSFVDEGSDMAQLLAEASARGIMPEYVAKLLAAFEEEAGKGKGQADPPMPVIPAPPKGAQPLIEPLSPRELEVLQLITQGLSNQEIGDRLFIALSSVKGHNRNIFGKLQVQRRTEAVARARELGLI